MNKKGFTLIELLIVVAIIGIIAAIAIPNLLVALQKGKQKATMGDMRTIGVAIESYVTDWSQAPSMGDDFAGLSTSTWFVPFYIKVVPPDDGWGNRFWYHNEANTDLYSIASSGRITPAAPYIDFAGVGVNLYEVTTMGDFVNDICFSDGLFTWGPQVKR
jgi:general secretion pathway protein G